MILINPMSNSKNKREKTEVNCNHYFELERIDNVPQYSPASTAILYKKVAIVVCRKCGEVRQQDL